jgi:hypothetical protein
MSPLDRPAAQGHLLSNRGRNTALPHGSAAEFLNHFDDDPLASARGMVNGVLWGVILWAGIFWVLF